MCTALALYISFPLALAPFTSGLDEELLCFPPGLEAGSQQRGRFEEDEEQRAGVVLLGAVECSGVLAEVNLQVS